MSGRRSKKGFAKLVADEELVMHEIANMDSGSELDLLDLNADKHRRGGTVYQESNNMCVCVSVCVCCVYVVLNKDYTHTHTRIHACMHAHTHTHTHTHAHTHAHTRTHTCTCTHTHTIIGGTAVSDGVLLAG